MVRWICPNMPEEESILTSSLYSPQGGTITLSLFDYICSLIAAPLEAEVSRDLHAQSILTAMKDAFRYMGPLGIFFQCVTASAVSDATKRNF